MLDELPEGSSEFSKHACKKNNTKGKEHIADAWAI
jgi:hypothetical protein